MVPVRESERCVRGKPQAAAEAVRSPDYCGAAESGLTGHIPYIMLTR